ncbi:MAG: GrpB family protein [Gammaproteobacteria bacterium]|nr:GrpB family protein [Gammaproteobacteria bacterium]
MRDSTNDGTKNHEAPVEVVAYDESWPGKFLSEKELLTQVLAPWLAGEIEHVGSTAIPGMPAKPIIDIMAPVCSLDASRPAIEAAASAGYLYAPYKTDVMHWFCKPSPQHRTHHLHLIPKASLLWQQRLYFRDRLRRDPTLAQEYADLKLRLAQQFQFDREAYTEAKGPFVERVLAEGLGGEGV